MHDASQQPACSHLPGDHSAGEMSSPKMVIHLGLVPGQTVSWRMIVDAEICAHGSRVWLTRIFSPYDHCIEPGQVVRVVRGERIWLCPDGDAPAKVTLTSAYAERRPLLSRWAARWVGHVFDLFSPRTD